MSPNVVLLDVGSEDEGGNGGKLDENVDGWTRGILEWISDGVTDNGSNVLFSDLNGFDTPFGAGLEFLAFSLWLLVLWEFLKLEVTGSLVTDVDVGDFSSSLECGSGSLDFLLGIVPSSTSVGGRDGNLDTGDDGSGKETSGGGWAEEESGEEWGSEDESSWGNHHLEGSFSGDLDASLIVWLVLKSVLDVSLSSFVIVLDVVHHLVGGVTDSLHGEGREEVWEHGTDKESSELGWLEDINGVVTDSSDEGTEESKSDETGRSDSETLTDSGGGVTSGIKSISDISDLGWESRHLSNSSGIVGDWSVTINGESNWE